MKDLVMLKALGLLMLVSFGCNEVVPVTEKRCKFNNDIIADFATECNSRSAPYCIGFGCSNSSTTEEKACLFDASKIISQARCFELLDESICKKDIGGKEVCMWN